MSLPAAPARPVRPGLAIALALLVGMFSTVFGLGALFDSEGALAPVVRLLMPAALLVAPIVVGVILRPLGASRPHASRRHRRDARHGGPRRATADREAAAAAPGWHARRSLIGARAPL